MMRDQADRLRKARREIAELRRHVAELRYERLMLAQLASEKPEFFNPLAAAAAKLIRDNVLAESAAAAEARRDG